MSLQCKKCESISTEVILKLDYIEAERKGGASQEYLNNISRSNSGVAVSPATILEVIGIIFSFLGKLFGFLHEKEKNKARASEKIIMCKDCGYWENF